MSSFTRAIFEPTGRSRAGRVVWRAAQAFQFDIGHVGSGLSVTVPEGFETDGPSVPWWLAPLARPGSMVRSAAVHDRLRQDPSYSKLEGDAVFLTALAAEGVRGWRRELAFLAVRLNRSRRLPQP